MGKNSLLVVTAVLVLLWTGVVRAADDLEMQCLLEPFAAIDLGTSVPGVLANVDVQRGQVVKKGQVVAMMDTRAEKAAVELAKARLEYANRRLERSEELYKDDLLSAQEKDELETEALLAELELRQARAQVEIRTIRSPINGIVVERVREVGEFVLDSEILRLAQVDPINVEVIARAEHYGRIQLGANAQVMPAAPVGGEYSAAVSVVDKVIDAGSGTFGVRLKLNNRDMAIPAGLPCTVRFVP